MRLVTSLAPIALTTLLTPVFVQATQAAPNTTPPRLGATSLSTPQQGLDGANGGITLRGLASQSTRIQESRRPLPLGSDDWRFNGEIGTRVAPIYLLPTEATRPAKLKLSYLSAVSVMPEVSRITVTVNDQVVGERYVRAASQPEALTFDIPAGIMQVGFNAVRVTARHAHRVDCSRDASYELWTQILPEHSGLIFNAANAEIRDVRDLPAVRPGRSGSVRIRARTPAGVDAQSLQQVSRAVQASILLGRFAQPVVELDAEESREPGLDIIVGTDAVTESLTGMRPSGQGPRIQISHDSQTDRVLLTISGGNKEEVAEALRQFEALATTTKLPGTQAGLRASEAGRGTLVKGGDTLRLETLGFETQRFTGRYYRQTGVVRMPADFYPGDYGRIALNLNAAYGAGLLPSSKLSVRVNGALVSTVPLARSSGDTLVEKTAYLPLGAFKPGSNTVDIEADTTASSDQECSASSQLDQRDRLLLGNTSEMQVPTLARIGTLPNLSSTLGGGFGDLSLRDGTLIHIPNPSAEVMEATLSLLAKIAAVSGEVTPITFAFEQGVQPASHTITIGALADIPATTLAAAGLSLESLRRTWQIGTPAAPVPQAEVPAVPVRVAAAGSVIPIAATRTGPSNAEQSGALNGISPQPAATSTGLDLAPTEAVKSFDLEALRLKLSLDGLGWMPTSLAWLEETIRDVYKIDLRASDPSKVIMQPTGLISEASTLVVSQRAAPKDLQTGWQSKLIPEVTSSTVIVAPTVDALRSSTLDLVTTGVWQQFTGRAISYERETAVVRTLGADATWFIPTEPLTPSNVRLIVAGWLSKNVLFYLGVLFGAVVLVAGTTYRLVRVRGARVS